MIELVEKEIELVSGGVVIVIPFAVKAAVAVGSFLGSAYGAYQAGKEIGGDIIQGIENS